MATFLFDDVVFGPVSSRRFGVSLGMNLLPPGVKFCSFNCIYCECGWTAPAGTRPHNFPSRQEIQDKLHSSLRGLKAKNIIPDNITFAGNGEPTLHPDFPGIVDDTLALRDAWFPSALVSVLSNSTQVHRQEIFDALLKVDRNVLKLDTAIQETFELLNQPLAPVKVGDIIEGLCRFGGRLILQSLFIRGNYKGRQVDNTTRKEADAWLQAVERIRPRLVMIYTIARETPAPGLEKIPAGELQSLAEKVEALGIRAEIYG
jgi:wyosine [tRNA(Phe)-imidazoG37] synthetase (radical SAM superfamily)